MFFGLMQCSLFRSIAAYIFELMCNFAASNVTFHHNHPSHLGHQFMDDTYRKSNNFRRTLYGQTRANIELAQLACLLFSFPFIAAHRSFTPPPPHRRLQGSTCSSAETTTTTSATAQI
jgi:hypothetical protein